MIDDATLMAYADGELDAQGRAEVEAATAADPQLAERLQAHVDLRHAAGSAFADLLAEPPPQRFIETIMASNVVRPDFGARRFQQSAPWLAVAASLMVGVFCGHQFTASRQALALVDGHGVAARGQLASALDSQLASKRHGDVEIGLTFASTKGEYCRTFKMPKAALAGLACRDAGVWRVPVTAELGAAREGGYRMAGSETPPAIAASVDELIAGEVFDARQEQIARDRGWDKAAPADK